jgi:hypothetical protein
MITYPERARVDVPIPEILRNLVDSVDGLGDGRSVNWDKWEYMKADEAFDADLDVSIVENGFEYPIGILILENGGWVQHNGHHRLLMAVWLCLETVPVIFMPVGSNDVYELDWNDDEWLFAETGMFL